MDGANAFTNKLHNLLKPSDTNSKGVVDFYSKEAEKYDDHVKTLGSVGPARVATKLADLVPSDKRTSQYKILDVGAGTGRIGTELKQRGFSHMDALEPCKEMLDVAISKNIYDKTFCQYFAGGTPFEVSDGSYDAVVISGCFVKGHLPVDSLREVARLLKPGGLFVTNNTHEMHSEDYDAQIESEMRKMEAEKIWKMVSKERHNNRKDVFATIFAFERI